MPAIAAVNTHKYKGDLYMKITLIPIDETNRDAVPEL